MCFFSFFLRLTLQQRTSSYLPINKENPFWNYCLENRDHFVFFNRSSTLTYVGHNVKFISNPIYLDMTTNYIILFFLFQFY